MRPYRLFRDAVDGGQGDETGGQAKSDVSVRKGEEGSATMNKSKDEMIGECGKPATIVEAGYGDLNQDRCFCKKCSVSKIEEGMRLPIVNSPRVGVCAYCG